MACVTWENGNPGDKGKSRITGMRTSILGTVARPFRKCALRAAAGASRSRVNGTGEYIPFRLALDVHAAVVWYSRADTPRRPFRTGYDLPWNLVTWSAYSSYLVLTILVVVAPGPDTVVTLKNAFAGGFRGGMMATFGIAVGNVLQGTLVALGLGTLIVQSQVVFTTIRWAGVAYLGYLGIQALRSAWRGDYAAMDAAGAQVSYFRRWREGFLSNVTNPKVIALYLSVLPQFLDPAASTPFDALLLAYTVVVLGSVWLTLLLVFVHRVRAWLRRRKVRRALDVATGGTLIGFGVSLAAG